MRVTFAPYGPPPPNVHALRNTGAGRRLLVESGRWTPEQLAQWTERRKSLEEGRQKSTSGAFVAWDGEGLDVNGRHVYSLLANDMGSYIENVQGLTTKTCLDFLCDIGAQLPNCIHVVYGGSYDSNMILADLSLYEVQTLCERGKVTIDSGRYLVEYRQRKYLRVVRYDIDAPWEKDKRGKYRPKRDGGITLWDVIGFFQARFVEAVSLWLPEHSDALEFVERMKANRGNFRAEDREEVRRYCLQECKLLRQLMEEFRRQCRSVGYVPNRWDGSGALAARILSKEKVGSYRGDYGSKDSDVIRAAQYAYFGGRIECVRQGNYLGNVWGHDLVSAYPSAMSKLPCLDHGNWRTVENPLWDADELERRGFAMLYVRFQSRRLDSPAPDTGSRIFPLAVRKQGMVYFPPIAEGWYWAPEVANLVKHHPGTYKLLRALEWVPDCDHKPFHFVPELFARRQQLKRNGHPAEKCLKLGLNSLYGKLAQQIGWRSEGDGFRVPPYHCLEWAGYITSSTRARLYDLAMVDPGKVIAFETDGMYSTAKHTEDGDGSLGSWEIREFKGITYVKSGIYWLYDGESYKAKYRGLDPNSLEHEHVLDAWKRNISTIEASSTRFHGMFQTSINPETFFQWRQWITEPRNIDLEFSGKRLHQHCACQRGGSLTSQEGLHLSVATPAGNGKSDPYTLEWTESSTDSYRIERLLADERYPEEC